jgi:hypothetical protein
MLTNMQIAEAKGLLAKGHKHHDIAAHFGVNPGRISEIATGKIGQGIVPAAAVPAIKPVRFFTPAMDLKDQIEILRDLIASATPDVARVYTISPALAEHIINNLNGSNRKPSKPKITEYVHAMQTKRWPVTGATLVFSKTGYLLDGQHRLLACIQANMPLTTFVVFNIPDGAFAMIDIGRKRTNTDAFFVAKIANSNVAAAATRWIMIHEQDPTFRHLTFTNDEMYSYYKQNLDNALFHECVTHAVEIEASTRALSPAGQRRNYCPAGPMAAYLYFFMMKNRKQASQFVGELVNMQRHGRVYIKAIRDRMDANSGRIHEVVRNALLVQAWNAFREGGRVSKQLMKWDWSEDFPVIR